MGIQANKEQINHFESTFLKVLRTENEACITKADEYILNFII